MRDLHSLLLVAVVLATLPAGAAPAAEDPIGRYLWKSRVLVAMAPSPQDPALAAQRALFAGFGADGRERDLVLVEATDGTPEGRALRRSFGGEGFRAVLIGKDGGEKLVADRPLGRDVLFPLIDAMPMRRDEMRRDEIRRDAMRRRP